jgi:hypothetical protein
MMQTLMASAEQLQRCKSRACRRAKAEGRGASPRGSRPAVGSIFYSSVAEPAMHFFRKEDHVGATPTGGPIYSSNQVMM